MTSVPVLWVSRHEGVKPRGDKYDQAVLEAIFDRSLWRPAGALEFEHHQIAINELPTGADWLPPASGAVLVVPSRDHVGDEGWLRSRLDQMAWAVVLLTSEEEWKFDWRKLLGDRRRFWFWQSRPEHLEIECPGLMPCGWYPGTREGIKAGRSLTDWRRWDWFFAGQVTHERRQECFSVLHRMQKKRLTQGVLIPTLSYLADGGTEGIARAEYLKIMSETKVVPCPSGPESLCTARVEEALEAGCVPIVDLVKPHEPQFNYWVNIFGAHPMRPIRDWSTLPEVMAEELAAWPANANRCWAWWQQWKRNQTYKLDDDIRAVRDVDKNGRDIEPSQVNAGAPEDTITVIITTSPCRRHPDTSHIEETIDSVRDQLPDAEIIVTCDGVRPEQEDLRERYEAYLHRLFWLTNFAYHNVVPVRLDKWGHQANATKVALELVRTPQVLFVEHDTPLVGKIDWQGLCGLIGSGEANYVLFYEDVDVHPDHEPFMVDHDTKIVRGVPVRRTWNWYARPHLASTRFWRERIMPHYPDESRTFIEDPLHGMIFVERHQHGESAWWDWRLFVYCPDEPADPDGPPGFVRHKHIDSRGKEEPKYDIWGFTR